MSSYMSCKLKHQFDHDPKVNVSPRVMYMELENVYETKHSRFANQKYLLVMHCFRVHLNYISPNVEQCLLQL